ncbi:MAG: hypothetical protein AAGJ83_08995, partial [Planctomycetota bacterium]
WSALEFQRLASVGGIESPEPRLEAALRSSESLLASVAGTETPMQADIDRQLSELVRRIRSFDQDVENVVGRLLGNTGFALKDPARSWQLTRAGWTVLRSPLPTSEQRFDLLDAIRSAPLDEDDVADREINGVEVSIASRSLPPEPLSVLTTYRTSWERFRQTPSAIPEADWQSILAGREGDRFEQRFAVALRLDPRLGSSNPDPMPILHAGEPVPVVRRPNVAILDQALDPTASPVTLSLDTLQDQQKLVFRVHPDREEVTRLLVSCELQGQSFGSPIQARWKIPGLPQLGLGETVRVVINDDQPRDLPLEISPLETATPNSRPVLVVRIQGESEADQVEGVVGSYPISVELPQANRLRVVTSAHRKIGCTKETVSGKDDLPGGLWLRTFQSRKTPFQLSLFNESGKPCRAKVWLVRLPNAMPMDVSAYWPDLAATRYSKPEGGMLDADGRIQQQFLRDERILLGPAVLSIPADQNRVPLDFTPAPSEDNAPPPSTPPAEAFRTVDVSHAMAVIARLVDENGDPTQEDDQVIVMAAKPWAPRNYVQLNSIFDDGDVEVFAELISDIDGDDQSDEIPQIEAEPLRVRWREDESWRTFDGEKQSPPDQREMKLLMQAGGTKSDFSAPVALNKRDSWVNIDVDGWPRAIRQLVTHQPNSKGTEASESEVSFSSLGLLLDPEISKDPPKTYYFPESEIYFRGRGKSIRAVLRADFATRVFNRFEKPEIQLQVGRRTYRYLTDRAIRTELVGLSEKGVVELLTTVSDITQDLNQGQNANDRLPLTTSLIIGPENVDSRTVTVVLDSTNPSDVTITADRSNSVTAPATLQFAITARDRVPDASGIRRIEFGVDTVGDGKIDLHRDSYTDWTIAHVHSGAL